MHRKMHLYVGGKFRDNRGELVEITQRSIDTFDNVGVFIDANNNWWSERSFLLRMRVGETTTIDSNIYLVTEILTDGDEKSVWDQGEDQMEISTVSEISKPATFQFSEPRNYLSTVDLVNIAEYVNKIEMIANKVGLEVHVTLHPFQEAP